jgi:hypothetical protein
MMAGTTAMPRNLTRCLILLARRVISRPETSAKITRLGGRMNHRGCDMSDQIKKGKNQQQDDHQ